MLRKPALLVAIIVAGLPAAARADVPFQDNFDDGNADGWDEFDGMFVVVGGEYELTHDGTQQHDTRAVAQTQDFTDFALDADFRSDTSLRLNPALLFRVEDIGPGRNNGHYYQFAINTALDWVTFLQLPEAVYLDTAPFIAQSGVTYHFRVEVEGDTALGFIDGQPVLSASGFTAYPAGRIGVKFDTSGGTASGRWDNVRVTVPTYGDFDGDGDVDTVDFGFFGQCFRGSNEPIPSFPIGCEACDADGDNDVDVIDFGRFAQNFTGSL